MAHHQHLVAGLSQGRRDGLAELRQPRLELRRVGAAPARREGEVMHQVIGMEPTIPAPEPPEDRRHRRQTAPGDHGVQHPEPPPEPPGRKQGQTELRQQDPRRVERGDHRPLAQPHQPKEGAGADIDGRRAQKLAIGGKDAPRHAVPDDIGPAQHGDPGLDRRPLDPRRDAPAETVLRRGGPQRDLVARHAACAAASAR